MTSWWRHVLLASKGCWESLCWSIQKKKMKKCRCVCEICSNEGGFPKISWRHKYSWDDVTVTWGQFLNSAFPNLDTQQNWCRSIMCFCYYCLLKICPFHTLSRDPGWRHDDVIVRGTSTLLGLHLDQVWLRLNVLKWTKWRVEHPRVKQMGSGKKKKKKKNQEKKSEQKERLFRIELRKSQLEVYVCKQTAIRLFRLCMN